ncbi:MAG: hypothetical protein OXR72_09240 [Gemmatimonadota bacterium]|nr:hypothetical protein [Gemmatimonadota bacterium]
MIRKVGESETNFLAFVPVDHFEGLEVTLQLVARLLVHRQCVEVGVRLFACFFQITSRALLLDEQYARPEQIDESVGIVQAFDLLLVAGDRATFYAEYLEEFIVKALCLALLVAGVLPLSREIGGAGADFIP